MDFNGIEPHLGTTEEHLKIRHFYSGVYRLQWFSSLETHAKVYNQGLTNETVENGLVLL